MADHLSPEQQLRYLDQELSRYEARKVAKHLSSCERCATELEQLKKYLTTIAEAELEMQPSVPAPQPWPELDIRLRAATRTSRGTRWGEIVSPLQNFWKVAVPVATAALVLILIGMLVWGPMQPVSAKEVVQRAIKADETRLKITPRQVVRQRVRVTKKPRLASGAQTARLESWKSTKFTYWETGGDALNAELLDRYKKSHISCDIPLSPRALESWMRIAGSEPSASRSGGRIEVNVASNSDARAHGLEDVSFRVESRGWHLDEMTLSFADATFQINEEQSSILDRREVPSDVLARLEPKHAVAAPVPVSGTPRTATSPVNLGDTEMAVRYVLHQAGADLGENIEITPHASSQQLVVNAWAVSPERKEHLVALLGNKHGIQLKLQAPG